MAYADIDGFRIDTVKHMDHGATRYFASAIKEFAMSIGKENFYLIGEITGGNINAFQTMEITGLDAALGIEDVQDKLEYLIKGQRNPTDYFSLFRNSELVNKDLHIGFRRSTCFSRSFADQKGFPPDRLTKPHRSARTMTSFRFSCD